MNRNLFMAHLKYAGYTQTKLAAEVGMSNNSMSRKLLGKREFAAKEWLEICKLLKIEDPFLLLENEWHE